MDIELNREAIKAILKAYRGMKGAEKMEYVGTLRFSDDHVVRRYVQRDADGELMNLIELDLMTEWYADHRFKVRVMGKYAATPNLTYTKHL